MTLLIDLPQQKQTLYENFSRNIKKMFGWDYSEISVWQEEKKWMKNDFIDQQILKIQKELKTKIISKFVSVFRLSEKEAKRLAEEIMDVYINTF